MANTKRKPAKGKPISSHPLFPAVVALWFGALFGLGSLAIRPTLIESIVLRTGVDLIVPAAAPPLGVTARILIALIMASLGAAIGTAVALRINRPKSVARERKRNAASPGAAAAAEAAMWQQRDIFTDGPARRPISVREELGETLDGSGPLVSRRRPLAVEHEDRPFEPHDLAPLPGGAPQVFHIAATRLAPVGENDGAAEYPAPLDLGAFPAPAPAEAQAHFAPMPISPMPTSPMPISPMIEREVPAVTEATRIFGMPTQDGRVPADIVRAAGFRTSVFETEPVQPLFAERAEAPGVTPLAADAAPEPAIAATHEPLPAAGPQPGPSDLDMTDLARRLQESMARRRAARSAEVAAPQPALALPTDTAAPLPVSDQPAFAPPQPLAGFTEPQPVASAPAVEIVPAPIPMPAALRPIGFDAPEDEDHADLSALMPRHLTMPTSGVAAPIAAEPAPEDEPEAAAPQDEAFASLLTIEMPRHEFVRVEEPEQPVAAIEPVVIFPGQMAAAPAAPLRPFDAPAAALAGAPVAQAQAVPVIDPAEAELALRSALANLQRISGAA